MNGKPRKDHHTVVFVGWISFPWSPKLAAFCSQLPCKQAIPHKMQHNLGQTLLRFHPILNWRAHIFFTTCRCKLMVNGDKPPPCSHTA